MRSAFVLPVLATALAVTGAHAQSVTGSDDPSRECRVGAETMSLAGEARKTFLAECGAGQIQVLFTKCHGVVIRRLSVPGDVATASKLFSKACS